MGKLQKRGFDLSNDFHLPRKPSGDSIRNPAPERTDLVHGDLRLLDNVQRLVDYNKATGAVAPLVISAPRRHGGVTTTNCVEPKLISLVGDDQDWECRKLRDGTAIVSVIGKRDLGFRQPVDRFGQLVGLSLQAGDDQNTRMIFRREQ